MVDVTEANSDEISYTLLLQVMHPTLSFQLNGDVHIETKDKAVVIEAPASSQTIDSLLEGFGSLMGGDSVTNSLSGTISTQ